MLILYSTLGCHLCGLALAIVRPYLAVENDLTMIDIADEGSLVEAYGVRIPVVKHVRSGAEIGWPFSEEEFGEWFSQQGEG